MQHTEMLTTRVASYGLLKQGGKILLCRISALVPGSVGKWTLPGGGIEFGESPEQAMAREIHEETGLQAKALNVAGVDSILVTHEHGKRHGIRIVYHTHHQAGDLVFEKDGSTDKCQWFSQKEANALPLLSLARIGIALAYPVGDSEGGN